VIVLSPRPGRIAEIIRVGLEEYPRGVELLREPAFFARCAAVSDALYSSQAAGAA
jgi:hypothetical protein